jgi:hypothetical protein
MTQSVFGAAQAVPDLNTDDEPNSLKAKRLPMAVKLHYEKT